MQTERLFTDTNLFLRYLIDDLPEQAQAFERLMRLARQGEVLLVTSPPVIAEIVWTLESYFRLSKADIQAKMLAILNSHGLQGAEEQSLLKAIVWYWDKNVDFIDAYSAAWVLSQSVDRIATFDKKQFARLERIPVAMPGE